MPWNHAPRLSEFTAKTKTKRDIFVGSREGWHSEHYESMILRIINSEQRTAKTKTKQDIFVGKEKQRIQRIQRRQKTRHFRRRHLGARQTQYESFSLESTPARHLRNIPICIVWWKSEKSRLCDGWTDGQKNREICCVTEITEICGVWWMNGRMDKWRNLYCVMEIGEI